MKATDALQRLERAIRFAGGSQRDLELVIPVVQPGSIGPRPMVPVARIDQGVDWDKNRVFAVPAAPVARHMPLVRGPMPDCSQGSDGFSVVQQETQLRERIAELGRELAELRASQG